MPPRDPGIWMWAEACEMLDRAERLRRQFFQPGPGRPGARRPSWEPPVDIYETAGEILIAVALPGVGAGQVEIVIDRGVMTVVGDRQIPVEAQAEAALIHRLEIPFGRFERRIPLPPGRLEIGRRELVDGCLLIGLRKLG